MIVLNKKYKTSKNVLISSFSAFIVIPVLCLGFLSYFYMTNILKSKITDNALNTLEQINVNIENEAVKIDNYIDQIANASTIQDELKYTRFDYSDYATKHLFDEWDKYLDKLFARENVINNVLLVSRFKGFYHYKEIKYLDEDELRKSGWYKNTMDMLGRINWIGMDKSGSIINPDSYLFYAAKAIIDKESFQPIGMLHIAVSEHNFGKTYGNIPQNSQLYVIDRNKRIIISSNHASLGKQLQDFPDALPENKPAGSYQISEGRETYLYAYSSSNKFGWRIVNKIPQNTIYQKLYLVRNITFSVIFLCIAVFAYFLRVIYRNLSKPLQYLVSFINEIESGADSIDLKKLPCYELLKISTGVVSLVEKNIDTSARLVKTEKQSHKMELAKLQAQVNPHFLYNTLDSIKYIALKNDQDLISGLVTSLVKLLKNSISREGEFIRIRDELANVKHYINIQSIIYENKINFIYMLDDKLDEYYVPNFILQPLVENCIFHGLNPNSSEGIITIRSYSAGNELFFEVEDNGKGMDEVKMNETLSSNGGKNSFTNIGLKGIHHKLKLIYGDAYGLKIKSKPGTGTTIIIKLPVQQTNDME